MKTKILFKLLVTASMLMITLALSNFTAFADEAPPSIPDPFGDSDDNAPPSLELTDEDESTPPSLELDNTEKTNTEIPGGNGSPSGSNNNNSSGGSPVLLNKKNKTTEKTVTDLDKDGDIDTDDEILFAQQQEQDISETGPGLGYLLFIGGILALRNLKKLKRT